LLKCRLLFFCILFFCILFFCILFFCWRSRKKEKEETEGYASRKRNISLLFENQCLKKRLLSGCGGREYGEYLGKKI